MANTLLAFLLLVAPVLAQSTAPTPIPVRRAEPVPKPAADAHTAQTPATKLGYNSIYVEAPYIAITFDDGPHGTLTPELLDILAKRNIKATFFVIGQCVQQHPDIIKRMADEGHEIGNHSWSHPAFARLSNDAVRSQINQCQKAVADITGKPMTILRPPYGSITQAQRPWITYELGLKIILWSVDPLDWKHRNASRVQEAIVSQTKNGSIILAHDIHPSTIAAMPGTLDTLLARGFKFVTVSELIAMEKPRPTPAKPTAPL